MPSVTKHRQDFNRFLSVKNMSEEGLEHDHITVNTNMYCEILLQQDTKSLFMRANDNYLSSKPWKKKHSADL